MSSFASTGTDTPVAREAEEDKASTIRRLSFSFSDGGDDVDVHTGDYSSRMEELLSDESDVQEDDSDAEEGFVYTGTDADEISGAYREQLRDVLGGEGDEDETSENEVEKSLLDHEIAFVSIRRTRVSASAHGHIHSECRLGGLVGSQSFYHLSHTLLTHDTSND